MELMRHARHVGYFIVLVLLSMCHGLTSLPDKGIPSTTAIPTLLSTTTPASFTIMTFNIHHGVGLDGKVNLNRIAELIQNENPDVIALQEVDRYRLRSGYVDQAKELAERLGMYMSFAPSVTYTVGQYGNAILSRYPIAYSSYTLLPGVEEHRSLLTATISMGSQPIRIAATHLGLSEEERSVQLAFMSEILSTNVGPLVVAGDFNMELDSFQQKFKQSQLSNIPFRPDVKFTFTGGKKIDYLFTNMRNIGSAWTVQTISSDHFPVMTLIPLSSWVRV